MTGDTMIEQAGFYRELGGADDGAAAPSLRDAARSTGERDEERLLAYLEASHEIYTVMGAERDVIADDVWITGAGSLITDGTYVWPTELAYYVRRHHVALLPEFAAHIRARNYVSPRSPANRLWRSSKSASARMPEPPWRPTQPRPRASSSGIGPPLPALPLRT